MPTYSVCNAVLKSDTVFPELDEVECQQPEFRFTVSRSPSDSGDCKWLHTWRLHDDNPWLLLGRLASGYLLRFPGLADFAVSQDAREIRCYGRPETPAATIRHLLLDQVIPLLLSRQGCFVLHSSAVSTSEGAIAFVGSTGSGKSTLASSFSEEGMAVLTDDCLLLQEEGGRLIATPSYPGVRLWPETAHSMFGEGKPLAEVAHYTEKRRVDGNAGIKFCTRATELRRLYFLAPPEEAQQAADVKIQPLSPRDAVVELVKYTYLIDVTDRQRLRQEFERLSRVAVQPLFYRLAFPHDFSWLPEVRQAILNGLRS
jgi:hypothetical protein